jgi:hypothetical protein
LLVGVELWFDWRTVKGIMLLLVSLMLAPFGALNYSLAILTLLLVVPFALPISPIVHPSIWRAAAAAAALTTTTGPGTTGTTAAASTSRCRSCRYMVSLPLYHLRWLFHLLLLLVSSPPMLLAAAGWVSGHGISEQCRLLIDGLPTSENLIYPLLALIYLPLYLLSVLLVFSPAILAIPPPIDRPKVD